MHFHVACQSVMVTTPANRQNSVVSGKSPNGLSVALGAGARIRAGALTAGGATRTRIKGKSWYLGSLFVAESNI